MYDHKLLDRIREIVHARALYKTRQTANHWLLVAATSKSLDIKTVNHPVVVEVDNTFGVFHHFRNKVVKKRKNEGLLLPITKIDDFVIIRASPKSVIIVLYTKEEKEIPPL